VWRARGSDPQRPQERAADNGQPIFHLVLRDCEHANGRPPAADLRWRQGVAQTQRLLTVLTRALNCCRAAGLPPTPARANNLSLVALLEALVEYGRKGR
jgi:hypothetical protein